MPPILNRISRSREARREFGRNFTRLTIGTTEQQFLVHEDLLCDRSPYFRSFLQPTRKDIEGDCSICLDELKMGKECLTYCTGCGCNFHVACIDEWNQQNLGHPHCPLCRGMWIYHNGRFSEYSFRELSENAFAKYHEWIYSGTIACFEVINEDDFGPLVSAYLFSVEIQDPKFGTAVLQSMLELYEDEGIYPCEDDVAMAYNVDTAPCHRAGIRRLLTFMIDTYLAAAKATWFEDEDWDGYPHEFLRDLVVAKFLKHPGEEMWSLETWKTKLEADEEVVEKD